MANLRVSRREFFATSGAIAAGLASARGASADAAPTFKAGPVRRVSEAGVKGFEPWIAANPRDAMNLVAIASRERAPLDDGSEQKEPAAWFTTDGGTAWSAGELAGAAELLRGQAFFADAHAAYAPDGTAFCVFNGSNKTGRLRMRDIDLWVFRSDDGGRQWQPPTRITGGGFDYPRMAVDTNGGRPRVFIAVATRGDAPLFGASKKPGYGCAVLRSDDGGRTFSAVNFLAPTALCHDPIDSPLVLPDGRLLVGFADYPGDPKEQGGRGHVTHGRIHAAVSRDGGSTFSLPVPVCDTLLRDGFVELAVDRSDGPRRGRIYAIRHSRSSRPPGLEVQTSDDGAVWTPPTPLPHLRPGPIPLAAAAVSSRGVLGLLWIQGEPGEEVRIDDAAWTGREHPWDLYFTAAVDGGATFTAAAPVRITSSRTDPKLLSRGYGTDYISLAPSPDGSFHAVWVDTRDGRREIQTVKIAGPA